MIVALSLILFILSKIPDFHSTWMRIIVTNQEQNRWVCGVMQRSGIKTGLILVAVLYLLVVLLCYAFCLWADNLWLDLQFLLSAVIVSVFNLAVAHQNYTGKKNRLTRLITSKLGRFYS